MQLEDRLLDLLGRVEIVPSRVLLDTGGVRATAPMLRGVWGRALRRLDMDVYSRVFEGRRTSGRNGAERTPLYLIRPAPADPEFAPAMDWTLIGEAVRFGQVLNRAWDVASGMGLGSEREPFTIRQVRWLGTNSYMVSTKQRWSLREAAETMRGALSGSHALELGFDTPLRLLRRGRLIENPTFTDIAVASLRRLRLVICEERCDDDPGLPKAVAEAAGRIPCSDWLGRRNDFVRWSGAQKREGDMRGVTGALRLPEGPGILWPLLVVGAWIHVGKGTVFGLGRIETAFPRSRAPT